MFEHEWIMESKMNEECGVFGVFNVKDAASLTYFGLHALQHRGQESSGIAASTKKEIRCVKGSGLLTETFNTRTIKGLKGEHAIGHVRYASEESDVVENMQPIMVRSHRGDFALAHNGNIVNANELRIEMELNGSIFRGTSDAEVIAHLIQRESGTMIEKLQKALHYIEGAFAFVILQKDGLYAIRDHNGLRPLSVAKVDQGYVVSSESCAFDIVNGKSSFDIQPGEIIQINYQGIQKYTYTENTQSRMCAMEYIYFSRPDSSIDGINVHTARRLSGRMLAKIDQAEDGIIADIVVGVPDSSLSAAIGYAEGSGLPYELGLIKNRYVGRTFIQPTQAQRERGVRMKLSAVRAIVSGKRIMLIDDSIVRGTTSKRIVQLLKDAGASEVHVRIGSPVIVNPCFYGVDMTKRDELISAYKDVSELCSFIGADSLKFLEIEELEEAFQTKNLCTACFGSKYPTPLYAYQKQLEEE